jgi:hypothetical protein
LTMRRISAPELIVSSAWVAWGGHLTAIPDGARRSTSDLLGPDPVGSA